MQGCAGIHLPLGEIVCRRRSAGELPVDDAGNHPVVDQDVLRAEIALDKRHRGRRTTRHLLAQEGSTRLDERG